MAGKKAPTSSAPAESADPSGERTEPEARGALTWAVSVWAAAVLCGIAALAECVVNGYGPAVFTDATMPAKQVASIGFVCVAAVLDVIAALVVRKHPVAAFICSAWCFVCAVAAWSFVPVGAAQVLEIVAIVLTVAGLLVEFPVALDASEKKHQDFF